LVAKRVAGVAGSAAGGVAGGFLNNPGALAAIGIVVSIITTLVIFRKDISEFFSGLGQITLPEITLPTIEFPDITFPDFPDITFPDFPDFPDFTSLFEQFFNQFGGGGAGGLPLPPDVEDTGLLSPEERAACECGTSIIQDIQGDVQEKCLPCEEEQPPGGGFIGPPEECIDVPLITGGSFNSCTGEFTPPVAPEPVPGPTLPPGFEGGGPSFEGGTIFPIDICNMSLSDIIDANPGISASQAADMKFQACEESDFDFGTNTGSGFGPGDDPTGPIVTGGATLESEAQRAACTSCDLFGLNCPICRGEIGA